MQFQHTARLAIASLGLLAAQSASAYRLEREMPPATARGQECRADGSTCLVFCDNGTRAGSMNWNGSVWTDGVKWDRDRDAEARNIVAANGSSCT